jgi:uncharacterized protein (DUF2235 family)
MPQSGKNKNIVVCCDGTGNQFADANSGDPSKSANSNVVKLYTALTINNGQVGYYHPGVGTMGAPQARSKLEKSWTVLSGLAFASGFMDNVEDAYRYLMNVYDDGDRIYLFGFSRGAYTIRALAAILHAYGLLCRGNEGQIPYVLRLFNEDMNAARKEGRKIRQRKAAGAAQPDEKKTSLIVNSAFKETFCHDVTLRFVGLWDTVSSVGWVQQPLRLLYSAQNPIIQTGRHAVSIDERRCFYQDNLWGKALPHHETPTLKQELVGADGEPVLDDKGKPVFEPVHQDLVQVWFAGVHSDVGGSYPQRESALPNRTLRWLLDEAMQNGLEVEPDRVKMIFGEPTEEDHAAAPLYQSPLEPGPVHGSLKGPWWLLEVLPHRYYVMDTEEEHWRIPLGSARRLPKGALVHPSVKQRLESTSPPLYRPKNLTLADLQPYTGRGPRTSANLEDFLVHQPGRPTGSGSTTKLETAEKTDTAGRSVYLMAGAGLLMGGVAALLRGRRS